MGPAYPGRGSDRPQHRDRRDPHLQVAPQRLPVGLDRRGRVALTTSSRRTEPPARALGADRQVAAARRPQRQPGQLGRWMRVSPTQARRPSKRRPGTRSSGPPAEVGVRGPARGEHRARASTGSPPSASARRRGARPERAAAMAAPRMNPAWRRRRLVRGRASIHSTVAASSPMPAFTAKTRSEPSSAMRRSPRPASRTRPRPGRRPAAAGQERVEFGQPRPARTRWRSRRAAAPWRPGPPPGRRRPRPRCRRRRARPRRPPPGRRPRGRGGPRPPAGGHQRPLQPERRERARDLRPHRGARPRRGGVHDQRHGSQRGPEGLGQRPRG